MMSSSSFFEKASILNNQAIEALLSGDHITAVGYMEMAIKLMRDDLSYSIASSSATTTTSSSSSQPRTMMASCCPHNKEEESVGIGNSSFSINTRMIPPPPRPPPVHYATTIEIPRMKSFETIVFNQAIHIPTIRESRADCFHPLLNGDSSHLAEDTTPHHYYYLNEYDKNIYISVAIFNFALTHHYLACLMKCKKAKHVFTMKAINLYNVVLNFLEKNEHFHSNPSNNDNSNSSSNSSGEANTYYCGCNRNIGSSSSQQQQQQQQQQHTAILIELASLNNLSQIHIAQGDYSKVHHQQHGNVEALNLVVETLQNQMHLLEPRVESLLLNLLLLQAPITARAA